MNHESDRRVSDSAVWIDRRQSSRRKCQRNSALERAVLDILREYDAKRTIELARAIDAAARLVGRE